MAAGSTYTPIASYTATGTPTSYTFTSIPGTYTDLVLVVQGTMATGSGAWIAVQFNGDTTANYWDTRIYGNGSATGVARNLAQTSAVVGAMYSAVANFTCNIQNYSNTNAYKNCVSINAAPTSGEAAVHTALWKSTAAITSVKVLAQSDTISNGTTLTLYGIAAA